MTLDEFTSLNIFHTISSIQYDKNELIIINIESEKEQLIIEPPKIKNDPNSLHTKIKDLIEICQNDLKKMALRFNKTLIEYINYKIELYHKNELKDALVTLPLSFEKNKIKKMFSENDQYLHAVTSFFPGPLSTDSIIQAAHYNNREEKILAMQKRYDQYIDKKGFKRKKALDLLVDEFRPWKKNTIIKYLKIPILQR
ncbi:uncharacterized protein METZ01_LOCUS425778 [marine metagenome]|uniref:Uncharacterized protein n=1 Tax=marine metagenome TaxID=408172 RepID=A0A382XPX2_9ZZZZ